MDTSAQVPRTSTRGSAQHLRCYWQTVIGTYALLCLLWGILPLLTNCTIPTADFAELVVIWGGPPALLIEVSPWTPYLPLILVLYFGFSGVWLLCMHAIYLSRGWRRAVWCIVGLFVWWLGGTCVVVSGI